MEICLIPFFIFIFFSFFPNNLLGQSHSHSSIPHYKFNIEYDHDEKRLEGKMQVRFKRSHYPQDELLFALPTNRFNSLDVRGNRKHRIVPVFSLKRFQNNLEDPKFPEGFDKGSLSILSVYALPNGDSAKKQRLDFVKEPNPELEIGYSIIDGLLRVFLPESISDVEVSSGESEIEINFITLLPKHTQEGGINGTLLTAKWHPVLLVYGQTDESLNPNQKAHWLNSGDLPSPATYELTWKSASAGTLITTPETHVLESNQQITISATNKPLKYFPLIFSKVYQSYTGLLGLDPLKMYLNQPQTTESKLLNSHYLKGHERSAKLFHNWSRQFLKFMITRYGLKVPWKTIKIVAVEAEYQQVDVWNNIVLVPLPNYKRSELLDRQAFGFLTRKLGQLWFGESIWNNQDTQLWLNYGLPAFFGLQFYKQKYGPESGIFDGFDWLNPHYRDHYFENMVLSIAPNLRYPILSSFRKNKDSQKYLQIISYKTAMVLSMLEYLLGKPGFKKGMQNFSQNNYSKLTNQRTFQQSMEKFYAPQKRIPSLPDISPYNSDGIDSLEWFFSQWFRTAQRMDYAFKDYQIKQLESGIYETEILIEKIGVARMPVVIALRTQNGRETRKISPGIEKQESIIFHTSTPPEEVSLDPDEKLLETSRINNHSFTYFRVRFAHDWKKQREHLVLMVPGIASNAIDGNSFGVGLRSKFDDYYLHAIPGYGSKNKRTLYLINLERKNFIMHGLNAGFSFGESAGIRSRGIRYSYMPEREPGQLKYSFSSSFSREVMISDDSDTDIETTEADGETNTFFIQHLGSLKAKQYYEISWNISNEQPALEWQSDYSYSLWQNGFGQKLHVGHRKWFQLNFIHGKTFGNTPMQKKFQLGSPGVLRGFPQQTILRNDHLLASRLDYQFPLISAPLWNDISAMNIQGILFYDQGKIWSDDLSYGKAPLRKNAGFGIEWTLDTVSLFQLPLKFEVAFPLDDPDYKKPQFIILGTLSGS